MQFSEDQAEAYDRISQALATAGVDLVNGVVSALAARNDAQLLAVLGKAGSGKTMLLARLVADLAEARVELVSGDYEGKRNKETRTLAVLAPTNKAASVLRGHGVPATTIHRILYTPMYDPEYEKIAERHNQKILYYVPWPSPGVYSRSEIATADQISGQRIRAFNPASYEFLQKLGAAPLEMPWGDVAPALAAGTIDGVATSTSSGVDGKLWQFTGHFNPLNWSTSTDVVTVNLDAWNALDAADREAIEALANEMQPQFWALSRAEDQGKIAILQENGITVTQADDSLREKMASGGRAMWAAFVERVPEAGPLIEAYSAAAKK